MNLLDVLSLDRPILFFDTETTGPNSAQDRIIELGFIQIKPDGRIREWQTYFNPGIPIPKEATEIHGITDAMVQGCRHCGKAVREHDPHGGDHVFQGWPTFGELADNLLIGFSNTDFGGYNVKTFDLPLMAAEFDRENKPWSYTDARILDGYRLWQIGQPRTLTDATKDFLGEKHEGAHRALDDVRVSLRVVAAQLQTFVALPRDVAKLHDLQWPVDPNAVDPGGKFVWKDGHVVINFGRKWKGTRLDMMTRRDLEWIATKADGMSQEVRRIAREAMQGRFPERKSSDQLGPV